MKTKNKIVICDIDGTIANLQHRLHFIKNPDGTKKKKPDWDSFHKACVDDTPYGDVIEIILNHQKCGYRLYFFSGRNGLMWDETVEWLYKHVGERWWNLQMREPNDRRPDTVIKLEMMKSLFTIKDGLQVAMTPDDVLGIYDDRQSVVDMWRKNGFRVFQVDAWVEESVGDHHLSQEKLESLNKEELMFLIEHERKHREMGADTSGWRDILRTHLEEAAKKHGTGKWRQERTENTDRALKERGIDPKDIH